MNMERITDLDDALLRCRPGISKDYAEEALAAYRAGACRACIVTTWIAVVFDLIEKMREIALFGNEEAKSKLEEFEKWQDEIARGNGLMLRKALEFERDLLGYVRDKFELIDPQQFIELSRLQDDRNRCAHPTLHREGMPYQPSGEAARAHLSYAMIHLMQQPPVQGRSALAELRKLISSDYFPRETAPAKQVLIESVFARPSDALMRGAVDEILFGFFTPDNTYYRNGLALAALSALIEIRRSVAEARLTQQTRKVFPSLADTELPYVIVLILFMPECRSALSDVHYVKLSDYVRQGPLNTIAPVAGRVHELLELREAMRERVNKLEAEQLATFIKSGLREVAVDRAVDLFCHAKNWANANYVADKLILPILSHLKLEHITRIIKAPSEEKADLLGSCGFSEFLRAAKKERVIAPAALDGLLKENNMAHYLRAKEDDSDMPFSPF
jgi:hypothetical protein